MQTASQPKSAQQRGMTLVELIVAAGIVGFVIAGFIASSLLFVQIALDHESRSDLSSDMRSSMELLSFDVRNALRATARADDGFTLAMRNSPEVGYAYDEKQRTVNRMQAGESRILFRNVNAFDVLTGREDEPQDQSIRFDSRQIAIERLQFGTGLGSWYSSDFTLQNFTLSIRN